MKHKHAELIKAWADGAVIQTKDCNDVWYDCHPKWEWNDSEYRIKPEPKPDVVLYGTFIYEADGEGEISLTIDRFNTDQFKFVFDGETLNPKSVEVINA